MISPEGELWVAGSLVVLIVLAAEIWLFTRKRGPSTTLPTDAAPAYVCRLPMDCPHGEEPESCTRCDADRVILDAGEQLPEGQQLPLPRPIQLAREVLEQLDEDPVLERSAWALVISGDETDLRLIIDRLEHYGMVEVRIERYAVSRDESDSGDWGEVREELFLSLTDVGFHARGGNWTSSRSIDGRVR